MFSELFGFSGFCHFFHQRLRTFETDNWTCVVSFGGELNLIVSVWICDCFFKIEADFTHLFLRIQRSFPGLHGFSLLLLSSSGWSAASPVHLYSTIPRSGQRSEDGDQHTVSNVTQSVRIIIHKFCRETYIKILHVILIRQVWNFNCSFIFDSCFWRPW